MGKKHKFEFDMGDIIAYMIKKSKILFTVSFLAFIISIIVSLLITPKYKSTVIVFPVSPASVSKSVMSNQYITSRGADLLNFGQEDECDQLLQIFLSREIKDIMNKKYNLMAHYGIDSTKTKQAWSKFYDAFDDNFRFRRTEYLSIVVNVYDTDSELAAIMANDVVAYADTLYHNIQMQRAVKAFELIEKEYKDIDSIVNKKVERINELSKMGVFSYDLQGRELTRAYYRALEKGKTQLASEIYKKMQIAQKYGPEFDRMQYELEVITGQKISFYYKYTEVRAELENKVPNKFVVEHPIKADKKAYPRRSFIVIVSTIAAFFLTLCCLVFVDSIKKYI